MLHPHLGPANIPLGPIMRVPGMGIFATRGKAYEGYRDYVRLGASSPSMVSIIGRKTE